MHIFRFINYSLWGHKTVKKRKKKKNFVFSAIYIQKFSLLFTYSTFFTFKHFLVYMSRIFFIAKDIHSLHNHVKNLFSSSIMYNHK